MSTGAPFVEVRETHSGVVVLYGDRAFKTKKPVCTPFLDFSSTAQRDAACSREVTLNKRLAPDVYLGLGHLRSPGRDPEPMVVMRRMPEETKLARRLDDADAMSDVISKLARMIARFHQSADRNETIAAEGSPSSLRRRWDNNLDELEDLCTSSDDVVIVHRIGLLAREYVGGRGVLLADRVRAGRIVDGHGDLLSDDIFCLQDGPRVLDCLDFDDQLRYLDGIDDAAFLAMDIEFQGHRAVAETFLDAYMNAAGDDAPASLVDHYIAYRAIVRAKVDLIRGNQGMQSAHDEANRHLKLAYEHLLRGRVQLGIVGGLPGTGKTTIATKLADEVGAVLISTDVIRGELSAAGVVTGISGSYGEGLYSPANRAIVYGAVLERAQSHLLSGRSVILDGSWIDEKERGFAANIAAETSTALVMLQCVVDKESADQRIVARTKTASEATPAIAHAMAATMAPPWHGAATIDTSKTLEDSVADSIRLWRTGAVPRLLL